MKLGKRFTPCFPFDKNPVQVCGILFSEGVISHKTANSLGRSRRERKWSYGSRTANAQPMRAEIDAKIDDLQPSVLVLDFAGVTFMDSSGIGLIMGRHRTMEAIGGSVIVRDPPPHIRRVIRLSGMERIAQIQIQKPSCREGDFGIGGGENA